MHLLILNGPNLNLLGTREPEIYGAGSLDDLERDLRAAFPGHTLTFFQSNHEGALIDRLQQAQADGVDGVVCNAGALTHTSLALADAITATRLRVVEVHISNVYKREAYRHHSYLSAVCEGTIVGLGRAGYHLAVQYFVGL